MTSLNFPKTGHGRDSILLFPTSCFQSKPFLPSSKGYRYSSGLIVRTQTLIYASSLSNGRTKIKGPREIQFVAKAQPVAVELVEGKLRDPQTSGDAIRQRFLDFYAARGHKVLPSASLVPDDPTVLLTIAGMLQFKPIFLGKVLHEIPNFKVVVYFYMRFPILQFDISPYAWQNFLGHQANMSMTYASEVP